MKFHQLVQGDLMAEEKDTNNEELRVGVYVCHCGINIAGVVDVEAVAEYAGSLPNVVIAKDYKYICSDPVGLTGEKGRTAGCSGIVYGVAVPYIRRCFGGGCYFQDIGVGVYPVESGRSRLSALSGMGSLQKRSGIH